MTTWGEVREALSQLLTGQPGALLGHPTLEQDEAEPPYLIQLQPWAEAAAAELHRRFGDQVGLTVGALPYPPGRAPRWPRGPRGPRAEPAPRLGPDEAETELDGPAVVRSGHTLEHGLLVRDRSGAGLSIATNGQVTAGVVDPATGEVVGGFAGFQTTALVAFKVAPGGTERIPLLIGTASSTERLGYAVPPGDWGVQVTLTLIADAEPPFNQRRVRRLTPVLPLTITA